MKIVRTTENYVPDCISHRNDSDDKKNEIEGWNIHYGVSEVR